MLLPIVATAFSIGAMYLVPKSPVQAGQTYIYRFFYPYWVLRENGLTFFGTPGLDRSSFVLDNLFCHVLCFYGLFSLILIVTLLCWTSSSFYRQEQYTELMMLALFMIYSVMENAMIYMPYGFVLLLLAAKSQWYPRRKPEYTHTLEPSL